MGWFDWLIRDTQNDEILERLKKLNLPTHREYDRQHNKLYYLPTVQEIDDATPVDIWTLKITKDRNLLYLPKGDRKPAVINLTTAQAEILQSFITCNMEWKKD